VFLFESNKSRIIIIHREVIANRPDINNNSKQKRESIHADRCGNTHRQKCNAK
jgi:hypothetical protein